MNDVMDTLSIPTIAAKSRKRATNFSNNGVTVAQKNEAWDAITREFNSSNAGTTRDLESLRRNYENRKKLLRQNMAKQRRELYRTGGGVAPVVTKEPGDEILMAIMRENGLKEKKQMAQRNKAKIAKIEEEPELDSDPEQPIVITVQAQVHATTDKCHGAEEMENMNQSPNIPIFNQKVEISQEIPLIYSVGEYTPSHEKEPSVISCTDINVYNSDENILGEYIVHDKGKLIQVKRPDETYIAGQFCIIKDEDTLYPGRIQNVKKTHGSFTVWVNLLVKNFKGGWIWPIKKDVIKITEVKNIIKVLDHNKISQKQDILNIDDDFLNIEWGD
ncbi:unnamed protein product [Psylliodes chrysocephalus]|uniref:Regulatory protein zeste n=1 Tax=Psylliodes chrysocephalus TaxID=3402493 RepID=A0A9P0GDZ4_9CUCU|nr:unnamed protein product [Psylliodes chrysocephala]